jgi:hypothetical protein
MTSADDWSDDDPFPARDTWMPPPAQSWQDAHGWKDGKPPPNGNGRDHGADVDFAGLAARLSASTWLSRVLPPVDRLLGDFVTTTTRGFIVGRTGLGKTMLGLAIAMGVAFGTGFLHWRSERPGRVLYLDGEMPADLLIQRIRDAARRVGREDLIGNLMVFSTEDAEEIAEAFPTLGMIEPLNTEAGQDFIKRLCGVLKLDLVIFDNVQALTVGVQKDEETWLPVLPLVQWLTKQRIGQLWLDHTGHATERQYGTATKSWRFDAVGLMAPLPDDDRDPHETAFTLSFDPPGKARRRTPENWAEFSPQVIRLRDDRWTAEPADKAATTGAKLGKVAPARRLFYDALISAITRHGDAPGRTSMEGWQQQAERRGLIEPAPEAGETARQRNTRWRDFRKAKSELLAARWIAVEDGMVSDIRARWE